MLEWNLLVKLVPVQFNEFNSRVNLPRLCNFMGDFPKLKFVKLPAWGWFGFNKSICINFFDIVALADAGAWYEKIVKTHPDLLDTPTEYSEIVKRKIIRSLTTYSAWKAFYLESVNNLKEDKKLLTELDESGFGALVTNGAGYISKELYVKLVKALPDLKLQRWLIGRFIIPTRITPRHFGSFEALNLNDLKGSRVLYINQEPGWYGDMSKEILGDLKDTMAIEGCTWHPNISQFTNKYHIGDATQLKTLLSIWVATGEDIVPLLKSRSFTKAEYVPCLGILAQKHLKILKKELGLDLSKEWKEQKTTKTIFNNRTYIRLYDRFVQQRSYGQEELSNFAVELSSIEYDNGSYVYKCNLYYKDQVFPCNMSERAFSTGAKFIQAITNIFLQNSLGLPIILPRSEDIILSLVKRFYS